jgi:phosphate transport system substrate-binding protein
MRKTVVTTAILAAIGMAVIVGCKDSGPIPKGTGGTSTTATSGGGGGERLNGAGATFIYPMMSRWTHEYDKAKGVKVNYQSIGSGGGIQQMTAKTVDFGCSDAPMNEEQLKKAAEVGGEVVHIPLVMGGVVPAYNLPGVEQPIKFTGPVLADIFLGKITKWNDKALADLNPDAKLPDLGISLVHRSDGSGTTYIWVDYLSKVSPEWKEKVGVGTSVKWPTGVGQKGNEGVAGHVGRTEGAIGYIELIYALQNKIKYGSVQNKEGIFVLASLESITAAASAGLTEIPDDLRYSLTNAPGKDSYPISGTSWGIIYVNQAGAKGQAVVDFLRWCLHGGQEFTKELHYARIPQGLVERADKKLDQVKTK